MFLDKVGAPKCGKVDFFQKLGLELGSAFQGVKMSTFDLTR